MLYQYTTNTLQVFLLSMQIQELPQQQLQQLHDLVWKRYCNWPILRQHQVQQVSLLIQLSGWSCADCRLSWHLLKVLKGQTFYELPSGQASPFLQCQSLSGQIQPDLYQLLYMQVAFQLLYSCFIYSILTNAGAKVTNSQDYSFGIFLC